MSCHFDPTALSVGDTVYVKRNYDRTPGYLDAVTKIGRRYVTLTSGRRIDLIDKSLDDGSIRFTISAEIYRTEEDYNDAVELQKYWDALRRAIDRSPGDVVSLLDIQEVATILCVELKDANGKILSLK